MSLDVALFGLLPIVLQNLFIPAGSQNSLPVPSQQNLAASVVSQNSILTQQNLISPVGSQSPSISQQNLAVPVGSQNVISPQQNLAFPVGSQNPVTPQQNLASVGVQNTLPAQMLQFTTPVTTPSTTMGPIERLRYFNISPIMKPGESGAILVPTRLSRFPETKTINPNVTTTTRVMKLHTIPPVNPQQVVEVDAPLQDRI